MKRLLAISLLLAFSASGQTAAPKVTALTIDMIMRGPQFAGYEPRDLRWAPDGQYLYFRWKEHAEPIDRDYGTWVAGRDGKGLRRLSDEEAKDAPPVLATWTRDRKRAVFIADGDVVLWDGKHRDLTHTLEEESSPRFTDDEQHVTFVRGGNLFELALDGGAVSQLTNIAGPDEKQPLWDDRKGTASQEFVRSEERKLLDVVARRAAKREDDEAKKKREHPLEPLKLEKNQKVSDLQLTPDGKYVIAFLTAEGEKVKKTIVPNYVTESGYTEDIASREKVGDVQPVTKLASISTVDGAVHWFASGLPPADATTRGGEQEIEARAEQTETQEQGARTAAKERDVTFGAVLFSEDGAHAVVSLRARDNKDWWLLAFDPAAARGRLLATVHDDAWVRRMDRNIGWLPGGENVWFVSEPSGWAHLWSVPFAGGAPRQMTSGDWEVDDVELSADRKNLYLTTSEESLYERHLYRMPVAGGARERLTAGIGKHDAAVSPDGRAIADLYSSTSVPTEVFVGSLASGSRRRKATINAAEPVDGGAVKVTTSPAPEFFTYPWLDTPIVTFRATDGVAVPARLYKSAEWKSGGPAVVFVHGAGYLQNVHRWWSDYFREYMFHHFLMEHGYLVLDVDYRGSAGHGRDWRTAIYRHMGGRDLADEVDAARWLEREYGVDSGRIGIYGGSYGGFMTLMAMFTAPSVFKAGAALRPVTDWSHYNDGYTSDILNRPQEDPEAYRRSSPIYFAEGLRGHLLICHGVADTNVHFEDTVRLVQKLIELHAQNWDLAIYPVENHGFVEPSSWSDEYSRIFRLFERSLK